jgi:RNA-splicing ligase RtcB
LAEEADLAYKNVDVVAISDQLGIATKVASLPLAVVKG